MKKQFDFASVAKHSLFVFLILSATIAFKSSLAQNTTLFGDPTCKEWASMDKAEHKHWINRIFQLLTHDLRSKEGEDKYKALDTKEQAVVEVSQYCSEHTESQAIDGAMFYLKHSVTKN